MNPSDSPAAAFPITWIRCTRTIWCPRPRRTPPGPWRPGRRFSRRLRGCRPAARRPASQGDGLPQDAVADPELQPTRGGYLSHHAGFVLDAQGEPGHVEVAVAPLNVD